MTIIIALLFALIGVLLYFAGPNPKWQEVGRVTFFAGLLVLLMHIGPQSFTFLK